LACVVAGGVLAAMTAAPGAAGAESDSAASRPSFVVVIADDQTVAELDRMPYVGGRLRSQSIELDRFFASFPLCCPSRASFLTGRYAHNHGVLSNSEPEGGYYGLDHSSTLPVWLQAAGYRTGYVGKYMNEYGKHDRLEIPPGWEDWRSPVAFTIHAYYGYRLNEDGRLVDYGAAPRDYATDVMTEHAVELVEDSASDPRPLLLMVGYLAPHAAVGGVAGPGGTNCGPIPALRHAGAYAGEPLPRPPSFNEADVSDKPPAIRDRPLLEEAAIGRLTVRHRCRLEALLAVDEGVRRIVRALRRAGRLEQTYLIYTSDNGSYLGEHRISSGKGELYDAGTRVPLLVRGPGVAAGRSSHQPALNADLAPTLLDLADARAPSALDGRSLARTLVQRRARRGRPILLQSDAGTAVRTDAYLYMERAGGGRELYATRSDPFELENLQDSGRFRSRRLLLARLLERLRRCSGRGCRLAPRIRLRLPRALREGTPRCAGRKRRIAVSGADADLLARVRFRLRGRRTVDRRAPYRIRVRLARRDRRLRAWARTRDGRLRRVSSRIPRCRRR
jgi:N-acetylglucosamine-6-sulfatase